MTSLETAGLVERRFLDAEVRALGGTRIGGYASVFMPRRSGNLGGFTEQVAPSAFDQSRARGWPGVVCRYNHDSNMVLGTVLGGTLRLGTDTSGLHYEVDVPATRSDILELVHRGDIRHSSFAFRVSAGGDEWDTGPGGLSLRTLHSVDLVDVAPVLQPAYEGATAEPRAALPAAEVNDLPDSAFAYISPGGTLDSDGKTVPRSLRHLPIHDPGHVRNALARLNQAGIPAAAKQQALAKIKAAARKFGIHVSGQDEPGRSQAQRLVEARGRPDGYHTPEQLRLHLEQRRFPAWEATMSGAEAERRMRARAAAPDGVAAADWLDIRRDGYA